MSEIIGGRWELEEMVAYMGNPDCTNPWCRRSSEHPGCVDYHCAYCHEPCPMHGHKECQQRAREAA